jgi:hypothetical protein
MLIGSESEIAGQLLRLRRDHGVTYISVFEPAMEPLAPVIARLRTA